MMMKRWKIVFITISLGFFVAVCGGNPGVDNSKDSLAEVNTLLALSETNSAQLQVPAQGTLLLPSKESVENQKAADGVQVAITKEMFQNVQSQSTQENSPEGGQASCQVLCQLVNLNPCMTNPPAPGWGYMTQCRVIYTAPGGKTSYMDTPPTCIVGATPEISVRNSIVGWTEVYCRGVGGVEP
ncbi:hypothetical protein AB3N59_14500 [Leptospira sp. WS92.C1]